MFLFLYKEPLKGSWELEPILDWRFFHLGYQPYERKVLNYVSPVIFSCEEENITKADKMCEEATKVKPVKKSSITLEIIPLGYEL